MNLKNKAKIKKIYLEGMLVTLKVIKIHENKSI